MKKYFPYFISTFVGALVWIVIGSVAEVNEAWDSPLYLSVGLPVMAIAVITISGMWPTNPWRWASLMVLVQAVALFYQAPGELNLWPLTLVIFFILLLVFIVLAYIGSIIGKKLRNR